MCKVPLPCKVAYSQVSGSGHRHLLGAIILLVQEVTPENTGRGEKKWGREGKEANKVWARKADTSKDKWGSVLQGDSTTQGRYASHLSQKTGDCLPTGHPSPSEGRSHSHWHLWLALWWQCAPMTRETALGRVLRCSQALAVTRQWLLESPYSTISLCRKAEAQNGGDITQGHMTKEEHWWRLPFS